jgi:hypothetical protein
MNSEQESCDNNLLPGLEGGDLARDLLLVMAEAGGYGRGESFQPRLLWKLAIRC